MTEKGTWCHLFFSFLRVVQFKAVQMLHYPAITKTAFLLYEKTKVPLPFHLCSSQPTSLGGCLVQGKPQKDISKVTLPNWPGMYNCFQSLRKINDSIKLESTRANGGLCAAEANHLETKLQIIKCFLFNSPDAHKSMYSDPDSNSRGASHSLALFIQPTERHRASRFQHHSVSAQTRV